jgi:two-component system sensor kinase FixL
LLGYADDEFPNSLAAWEGLVAPQDLAALRESSRQHRLGQIELYEVEYRARHKDGSLRWIRSRGKVQRDERGRPLRFAGIDWDVTERVQAQERLEEMVQERTRELHDAQAELLRQEKLAVLGKLAGGVAHELRNPLGNITNSAYFLNMVLADVEPEAQEALRILDEEVRVCERIINSLLNFARTRSPVQRYTNLHDVIQETLSHTDMPENVQLAYSADDELPPVLTDPEQLSMVLGNIVRNAIQAMTLSRSPSTSSPSTSSGHRAETPEGGRLSITVKEMDAEWAVVSISDTGTGMSQEHLQQVFEPFFTTRARGIGLGLALARDLVEANGGRIEAQSQLGQGSVFSVYLPLAWPAA